MLSPLLAPPPPGPAKSFLQMDMSFTLQPLQSLGKQILLQNFHAMFCVDLLNTKFHKKNFHIRTLNMWMTYICKLNILFAFPVIFTKNKGWGWWRGCMEDVNFISLFSLQVTSNIMDWPSEKAVCWHMQWRIVSILISHVCDYNHMPKILNIKKLFFTF